MPPSNHLKHVLFLKHALFTFLLTTSWLQSKKCELGNRASACISRTSFSSELQVYIYFLTKWLQTYSLGTLSSVRIPDWPFFCPQDSHVSSNCKWCVVCLSIQTPNLSYFISLLPQWSRQIYFTLLSCCLNKSWNSNLMFGRMLSPMYSFLFSWDWRLHSVSTGFKNLLAGRLNWIFHSMPCSSLIHTMWSWWLSAQLCCAEAQTWSAIGTSSASGF